MIKKSFQLDKNDLKNYDLFLLYGENEGSKNIAIKSFFQKNYSKNIYRYEEKEILDNEENFFNTIFSKSFFENDKLVIIFRASDKIKNLIDNILEKRLKDIK